MSQQLTSADGYQYFFQQNDRLGSGAFGDVFKGFDKKRIQHVAIKRVHNSVLDRYGEEFVKCLGNEANILQEMGSGNHTVTIIDCFQTSNHVNIIMEFCDGGNLGDRLRKAKDGRFEESEAIKYMSEIVDGLYEMHKSGRMHRDLKLENIFLKEGLCKIGDFGFATKQPQAEQYVGTPEYMAPEIFDCGDGNTYDKSVDVWALGIMFHEMLFGKRPYEGPQTQLADKMRETPYQSPEFPPTSAEVKGIIRRMIEVDPKKRITIQELRNYPLLKKISADSEDKMLLKSTKSAGDGKHRKISGEYWDLSPDMKHSLTMSLTNDYIHRIYSRLENYRQGCGFFLRFASFLLPFMRAERNFVLDDLHIFMYYMLKFAHNKFTFLLQCLEKSECPRKLFKPVEADYWQQFVKSDRDKYEAFKNDTKKGAGIIENLFVSFRMKELKPYLERSGRSVHELDTIYNSRLDIDCTASFKGKLMEANYILQKVSQNKKDKFADDIVGILVDLEFGQLIEENMDDFKVTIDYDGYKRDKEMKAYPQNVRKYLKARTW